MDDINTWIASKTARIDSRSLQNGLQVKHVVPSVFDAYALLYHPYRIPVGKVVFEWEQEIRSKQQMAKEISHILNEEYGIAAEDWVLMALESERYDFEELLAQKVRVLGYEGDQLYGHLQNIKERVSRIMLQPLRTKFTEAIEKAEVHGADVNHGESGQKREISWRDIYQIYGLPFSDGVHWPTLSRSLKHGNRIVGQEMPEMDCMPHTVCLSIAGFLNKYGVGQVIARRVGASATVSLTVAELSVAEGLNLIASPSRDWLFLTPSDFCRTVIAGNQAFVERFLKSGLSEVSALLRSDHHLIDKAGDGR
jgi:hypothetical protein